MQADEFAHSLKPLLNFYGKKLNDLQLDMWFQKVGWRDAVDLRGAIGLCTSEEKQFPTPSVLGKYLSMSSQQRASKHGSHRPVEDCKYCQSTGLIHTIKDRAKVVFKCPRCKNCTASFRVWEDKFYTYGYRWENEYLGFDPEDSRQVAGLYELREAAPKIYRTIVLKNPEMDQAVAAYTPTAKGYGLNMNKALGLPEMSPAEKERLRQESLKQDRQREGGRI